MKFTKLYNNFIRVLKIIEGWEAAYNIRYKSKTILIISQT